MLYDAAPVQKGPKRINLNDGSDTAQPDPKYSPPTSLTVHLSKIPIPELQPRVDGRFVANSKPGKKDDKTDNAAREAEEKRRRMEEQKGQVKRQ